MGKQKKKKETWMKPRHSLITKIAYCVLYPYTVWKYGIKVEKFKEQGDRPYLILYNHQTGFDQFFVGMTFKGPVYYLATEDIFSLGFLSSLLRFAVAPIPIKKQTTDIAAVKTCYKVAKEGGTIAIAPEGNRTYSGKTEYMNPAIATMAKKMKLPIVLYRIEGGYFVSPNWSEGAVRRGYLYGAPVNIYTAEQLEQMSVAEINEIINRDLHEDAYERQRLAPKKYKGKDLALGMENLLFLCPYHLR